MRLHFAPHRRLVRNWSLLVLGLAGGAISPWCSASDIPVDATLQVQWDAPGGSAPTVLKTFTLSELQARKWSVLNEKDPLSPKKEVAKFQGLSLAALVEEATKSLTAAERSTTDLVILKTRHSAEISLPKAFLVKYPQIQVAFKRNSLSLGEDAPRIILPATSNAKIQKENILLEPMFITQLASVTLTSYERRSNGFFLTRRTDPAAMRGEKLFLQNCISCHAQKEAVLTHLTAAEKIEKVAQGEHPVVPGNHGFQSLFDKKALRSLVSYLAAFRFEQSKN